MPYPNYVAGATSQNPYAIARDLDFERTHVTDNLRERSIRNRHLDEFISADEALRQKGIARSAKISVLLLSLVLEAGGWIV